MDIRKIVDGYKDGIDIAEHLASPLATTMTAKARAALTVAAESFDWISARALADMKDGYRPAFGVAAETIEGLVNAGYAVPWHHVVLKDSGTVTREWFLHPAIWRNLKK